MNYTEKDEILIGEAWNKLLESCQQVCKNDGDWDLIKRAFFLAKEAHAGVRRRSGEPYLLHPIAVAQIAVDEIGLGVKSVVAALLHDVVEDTDYTEADIERIFGAKISSMVDGLTKISGVFTTDTSEQAESFRKVIMTLADNVRVILIKIADRLHNMRTLGSMPPNKQIKITSETMYLFAPLAHRLGLFSIKSELEDLCMKYRFPEEYNHITQKLRDSEAHREEYISKFIAPIRKTLDRDGFNYDISGRVKSIYSIWSKMQRKQIPFEEVYDLIAVRVVFKQSKFPSEKTQCWQIYSSITDIYTPKPDRLRDWISMPKDNGYEALHSTVMGPDGNWVEVQIRTQRMEDIAERGFAAHWKYKKAMGTIDNEDDFDRWLGKVRDALELPSENAVDFLDNFKLSLYTSEILIFTPKGEPRKLPYGATALDFAYDIHSKIGNEAIGAKINYRIEPITKRIYSGDQIEIITSASSKPKAEWLEHVVTAKATQSIKTFLKGKHQDNIKRGRELYENKLKELGIQHRGQLLRRVIEVYNVSTKEEFYSSIGAGILKLDDLEQIAKEDSGSRILKFWKLFVNEQDNQTEESEEESSNDSGNKGKKSSEEILFELAECCEPIPGDQVVGFRDIQTGKIIVHKAKCDVLDKMAAQHGNNIVKEDIKWSQYKRVSYLSSIYLRGIDRLGLLLDLTKVVTTDSNINMREIKLDSKDGIFKGTISLYINDTENLNLLMQQIRKIKGIDVVKRNVN
ncbi:MAG: RelA/SpoT family protein [Rikenellaceae bacterium]